MKVVLLLCSLSAAVSQARDVPGIADQDKFEAPWFCHDLDCPEFKVLKTNDKYEIREYKAAKWAGTKTEAILYSVGVTEGFKKLFSYISGKNEDKKKIAMTAPVATKVEPGEGPFCKSTFLTAFFVPYKYQDNPPKPSDPEVNIIKVPKEHFAVLAFGGFLVDDFTLNSKAKYLQAAVEADGLSYDNSSFFSVGYDPPYRLQHRHNEIWIKVSDKKAEEVIAA